MIGDSSTAPRKRAENRKESEIFVETRGEMARIKMYRTFGGIYRFSTLQKEKLAIRVRCIWSTSQRIFRWVVACCFDQGFSSVFSRIACSRRLAAHRAFFVRKKRGELVPPTSNLSFFFYLKHDVRLMFNVSIQKISVGVVFYY